MRMTMRTTTTHDHDHDHDHGHDHDHELDEEQIEAIRAREREDLRRFALAQIRQYPDHALRLKAKEVTEFDDYLNSLVERMLHMMQDAQGVGLAATQLGILQRVFVFELEGEAAAGRREPADRRSVGGDRDRRGRVPVARRAFASPSSGRSRSRSKAPIRKAASCASSSRAWAPVSCSTSPTIWTAC